MDGALLSELLCIINLVLLLISSENLLLKKFSNEYTLINLIALKDSDATETAFF